MQIDFLSPPAERLRADGTFETVFVGGLLGRLRPPVVLLARDLCTFALFESGSLPANRRRQAARLYARTASPYLVSGAALVKSTPDFAIWWWDLERILPMTAGRYRTEPVLRPETVAQPRGSSWRIVRLDRGYEAQLWREKGLIASVWQKERFDVSAWTRFVRLQRNAPPAAEGPPPAETLPIAADSEAFSLSLAHVSREQAAIVASSGFALVVACFVALLFGQGFQLAADARSMEKETAEMRAQTARPEASRARAADRQKLAAYRQIEQRTNPVSAAGAAIGIVALLDLTPRAVDADEDTLTLTLPYSAVNAADELVMEFENSGYFTEVQPRTNASSQTIIFEMKVVTGAEPLSAGE
ncbi:hypothetical protein [Brevundimonas sp. DC300-4]|uniref:hypothetical protein n=1 Tax=Brevundimonas sp. DC300-4 TaxID=2804594 RepID=UPI003CEBE732